MTQTLALTLQISTTSYQDQTVYNLQSAITLTTRQLWDSQKFFLHAGSTVYVTIDCSGACIVIVYKPNILLNFTLNGSPTGMGGSLIVPESGQYYVEISNIGFNQATISSLTVVEHAPVSIAPSQTSYYTIYNTVEAASYSSYHVTPYAIIGILPSTVALLLLGIAVLFIILLDQGIISVNVGRKETTRQLDIAEA